MDAETAADLATALTGAPPEPEGLTPIERSRLNLRRGNGQPEAVKPAEPEVSPRMLTNEIIRVLHTKERGKLRWLRRVALGIVRKASEGNASMAALLLDRVEGPISTRALGAGGVTINVVGMVHVGRPTETRDERLEAVDVGVPTLPE